MLFRSHEHTMASGDYMLAKAKKQLTKSNLEHAKAGHDLATHAGDQPKITNAAAKVDKLENKLDQHRQAVQAAADKEKQEKKDAKEAKAKAKAKATAAAESDAPSSLSLFIALVADAELAETALATCRMESSVVIMSFALASSLRRSKLL